MSCPVDAVQTFVITLMSDSAAQCAFGANPVGMLAAAGLSELTPADLRDALPGVPGEVPAPVADALASGVTDIPAGEDPTTMVVAHLQALVASAQAVPASGGELPVYAAVLNAVPAVDPNLGEFDTAINGSATGVTAATYYANPDAVAAVVAGPNGLALSTTVDSTAASPVGLDDNITAHTGAGTITAHSVSALGSFGVAATGSPTMPDFGAIGDPAATLDSLVFGKADATAATAAGYVSTGGHLAAGTLTTGSHTLGNDVTTGGATAGHAVASGGADLATHVTTGTTTVADTIAHGPAAPALPTLAIPTGVPGPAGLHHLEHHLPSPAHLPEATEFGHEVHDSSVAAGVAHSPLATMTASLDHTTALADCADVHSGHTDLPLGH